MTQADSSTRATESILAIVVFLISVLLRDHPNFWLGFLLHTDGPAHFLGNGTKASRPILVFFSFWSPFSPSAISCRTRVRSPVVKFAWHRQKKS